jgi:tripartite motif-containing protein 71
MPSAAIRGALLFVVACAALLAGAGAVAAPAPTVPTFDFAWGHPGSGAGQFNGPNGVAVDAAGNVLVVDHNNHRVQKFDARGRHLASWGTFGAGNGQFSLPTGVAADAAGNVYVADYGNHRVQKFTGAGTYVAQWGGLGSGNGQLNHPQSLAIDAAGRVLVADTGNHRLQLFTAAGAFVAAWGTFGDGDVQFDSPNAVAVDARGRIYVADYGNHRLEIFSEPGVYEDQWGGYGTGNGQFANPSGVAVDALGFVYVVDRENHRLQKFDSAGAYVGQWGGFGTGAGLFAYPTHVAVDAAGNVVVSDFNNQRVQRFSGSGVARSPLVPSFARVVGAQGTGLGQFTTPIDIAADASGYLYVLEFGNSRVQVLDPGGTAVAAWGGPGSAPGQFASPQSLAVGPDGFVYVADYGNSRVQKLTTAGAPVTAWGSAGSGNGQFAAISAIAVGDDGFVYVGDRLTCRVQKFTSSGAYVGQWGSAGHADGQFMSVDGIAVDKSGAVYVADDSDWRLQKFSAAGGFIAGWWYINGKSVHASSVDVGPSGEIFYTDTSRRRVEMISSSGDWLGGWDLSGSGTTPLNWHHGVAFDREGHCWVADTINHRVVQFGAPPVITQASDVKNDQGRQVRLRFLRAGQDAVGSAVPVLRYDIYRQIDATVGAPAAKLAGWEQVGSVSARGDTEYNAVVPALANASSASVQYSGYLVSAVTASPTLYYDSPPAYGYSLDNLSPPAPVAFAAAYAGGATRLHWAASPATDFAGFRLYRGASAGFTPAPANLVAALTDTGYVDNGEPGGWYRLCAVDFDGNVSPYALVGPQQTSPVPDAASAALRLHQNEPNPFNPQTVIRFDLPRAGRVQLRVHDLRGRLVRTLVDGDAPGGSQQATWDGRDDRGRGLASGIYVARLTTADGGQSVRMTLVQ